MIRALYTAASGMTAQQMNLDTIANNLANSSTTGFRQLRLQFQDMIYQNLVTPGAAQSQSTVSAGLPSIPSAPGAWCRSARRPGTSWSMDGRCLLSSRPKDDGRFAVDARLPKTA